MSDDWCRRPSFLEGSGGKWYCASDFRGSKPNSVSHTQDVARHKYDCSLAAAAASFSTGPRYSDNTLRDYSRTLSSQDNYHYYGSSRSNYNNDQTAARKVVQSAYTGDRTVLTPHQAAHIREGAQWLAEHKNEFNRGFINSASALYANVYDQNGHKVVDRRAFR